MLGSLLPDAAYAISKNSLWLISTFVIFIQ